MERKFRFIRPKKDVFTLVQKKLSIHVFRAFLNVYGKKLRIPFKNCKLIINLSHINPFKTSEK